ncbi:MAG TPA: CPBP family intramembrane glutamic endopeptidase [Bacteroidales bacterium]
MRIAYFESIPPIGKLLFLLILIMLIGLATALSGLLIGEWVLGIDMIRLAEVLADPQTRTDINFGKFYQLINQFGVFIFPVLVYNFFVSTSTREYLQLKSPRLISILVSCVMVFSILPFLNYLSNLNAQMVLPEFLSGIEDWMKSKEAQASLLTENFLKTSTLSGLFLNIVIVALIPAFGEEMLFRGVIQKLMLQMTKNIHWAVIISALVFSAFHIQFYGFLPRFLLGLLLGYLFIFTGSLWVPIIVHFVNNLASVIVYFLHYNGYLTVSMENFGSTPNPVYIIGSLLITVWLLTIVYHKEGKGIA